MKSFKLEYHKGVQGFSDYLRLEIVLTNGEKKVVNPGSIGHALAYIRHLWGHRLVEEYIGGLDEGER